MKRLRDYLDHSFLELNTDVTEQPFFSFSAVWAAFLAKLPPFSHRRLQHWRRVPFPGVAVL